MLAWRSSRLTTICFFTLVATLLITAAISLAATFH